jgi:hypothetical protein
MDEDRNLIVEYYQAAFLFLYRNLDERINEQYFKRSKSIREDFIKRKFPQNQYLGADIAWPILRQLLDQLEGEIKNVLATKSVFFWMHLYRRIAVVLPRKLESNSDPRTVGLVRNIVELAIAKHGRADATTEFSRSNLLNPDRILGGFMKKGVKAMAPSRPSQFYKEFAEGLRHSRQWVIRDFAENDLLNIYFVEGLAYQYWRITALMRTLGKGARVIFSEGDWDYEPDHELAELIKSVDERTDNITFNTSLLGVWFEPEGTSARSDLMLIFGYNIHRRSPSEMLRSMGLNLADGFISNFWPNLFNARAYLDAHRFLTNAFRKRHGFTLDALLATLWASVGLAFSEVHPDQKHEALAMQQPLLQLLQRGYRTLEHDILAANGDLYDLASKSELYKNVSTDEIQTVIKYLSLTPDSQKLISLWSNGPQFQFRTGPEGQTVIDLQGIQFLLSNLFFRVAHDQTHRGTVFEEAFQKTLEAKGFKVHAGVLESLADGIRELDAGVMVRRTLYVLECVSVERPLDYELGSPKTLKIRQQRLEAKVDQVLTLGDFIRRNPKGKNYDFSDSEKIVPLVVSPFEEWIWEKSSRLWETPSLPRIVSAAEAIRLVLDAREETGS